MSKREWELHKENRALRMENIRLRKQLQLTNKLILDQRIRRFEDRYK